MIVVLPDKSLDWPLLCSPEFLSAWRLNDPGGLQEITLETNESRRPWEDVIYHFNQEDQEKRKEFF